MELHKEPTDDGWWLCWTVDEHGQTTQAYLKGDVDLETGEDLIEFLETPWTWLTSRNDPG